MVNSNIKNMLLDSPYVSNITEHADKMVCGRTYLYALNCDLLIREYVIPVIICVPDNWKQDLIHIFIKNPSSIPYMPHIDKNGQLCLFDLEGTLIDFNFHGLLIQCIKRAVQILEDGFFNNVDEEFVNEFSSYWGQLPRLCLMKISIQDLHSSHLIKYIEKPKKDKGQPPAQYISNFQNTYFYATDNSDYFSLRNVQGQQQNGIFCYVSSTKLILPPDFRNPLSLEYVNQLFSKVSLPAKKGTIDKFLKARLIIFFIQQPNGVESIIAIIFKNGKIEISSEGRFKIHVSKNFSLSPIEVVREDKAFSLKRTNDGLYNNKKILLIGCGSIGGYVCNELVKTGFENITVVDNDILKAENIYRHFLGMEYIDQYKANALCNYFQKNMPNVKMKSVNEDIIELLTNGSIDLSDYDLIISAIGDHNINRQINEKIYENDVETTVIYGWNEPLDIGCHVAVISKKYKGCYNCFFKRDKETDDLYDAVAYASPRQNFSKKFNGCGGSYIPYGADVSLKTASICMDWVGRVLDNRCNDNYLISYKGEGYYFNRAGFKTSAIFDQQETEIVSQHVSMITEGKGCMVCGKM